MPITSTGEIIPDSLGNPFIIGDLIFGSVSVTGGSVVSFNNATIEGDNLRALGLNASATGTLRVEGAGSSASLIAPVNGGAGFVVGIDGTGNVRGLSGASLAIESSLSDPDAFSILEIASSVGSRGTVELVNSRLNMSGYLNVVVVGLGGTGNLDIDTGSTATFTSTLGTAIAVGGTGSFLNIMTIEDGASASLSAGGSQIISADTPIITGIGVGEEGAGGLLGVDGDLDITTSRGTASIVLGTGTNGSGLLSMDGGDIRLTAESGPGNAIALLNATMTVGARDGVGLMSLEDSNITLDGEEAASIFAAFEGGTGDIELTNSTIGLESAGPSEIFLATGLLGAETTGEMTLGQGSSLSLAGSSALISVANGSNTTGTLQVSGNSSVDIEGQTAGFLLGDISGANATATFTDSTLNLTSSDPLFSAGGTQGSQAFVGVNGGAGNLTADGSDIVIGAAGDATVQVGLDGGQGTVSLNNSSLTLDGATSAQLILGENSGGGNLTADGSDIVIRTAGAAAMQVGLDSGQGMASLNNSNLTLDGGTSTRMIMGENGGGGTANLVAGNILLRSDGASEFIVSGLDETDSFGLLNMNQGSNITVEGSSAQIAIANGRFWNNTLTVDNSTITVTATGAGEEGRLLIGSDGGADIRAIFQGAGTSVTADVLEFGTGATARGSLEFRQGAEIDVGTVRVGANASLGVRGEGTTISSNLIEISERTISIYEGGTVNALRIELDDSGFGLGNGTVNAGFANSSEGIFLNNTNFGIQGTENTVNGNVFQNSGASLFTSYMSSNLTAGRADFKGDVFAPGEVSYKIFLSYYPVVVGKAHVITTYDFTQYNLSGDGFFELTTSRDSDVFATMVTTTHSYVPASAGAAQREMITQSFTALSETSGQNATAAGALDATNASIIVTYDLDTGNGALTVGQAGVDGYEVSRTKNATDFSGSNGNDILGTTGSAQTTDLKFRGGDGADVMTTSDGNDLLDGGTGTDLMTGGVGNDSYIVDNLQDIVVEQAGEGDDIVYTSISLTIPVNVEVLIASGASDLDLTGSDTRDIIQGNSGSNIINGAGGFDVMVGGVGNDVYAVDNSLDAVIEAVGEGYDNVYSSIDFIISEDSEIESVLLTGNAVVLRGSSTNNQIFGNDVVNVLDGRGGIDYLLGFGGGDIFQITAGDDGEDVIGDFSRTDGDRIAFAGFDGANTTVTHEGDGLFTIADATAGTSQTFQMRDGYGIDAYTSGDLVEGQDYYFA